MGNIAKDIGDAAAAGTVIAAILKWLPPLAALLSIVWLGIRIYEYRRWVKAGRKGPRFE